MGLPLGITTIDEIDPKTGEVIPFVGPGGLSAYEGACRLLAEARRVDDVLAIADKAEALRVIARRARNRDLEIDAAEIRIRAERRLGEMVEAAKAAGEIGEGRPRKNGHAAGQFSRVTLAEAGIDRNLSSRAQRLAALADDRFEETVRGWRARAEDESGRVSVRLLHDTDKKAARAVREEILGRQQRALPDAKFGVIYADPEWRFDPYSRDTGLDRAADNHYPTSSLEEIKARNVASIAADDCVLFLWATAPMTPQALEVMKAWGFDYRSQCIWRKAEGPDKKVVLGTGYWFRNAHELLLVGVRGKIPAPAPGTQFPSVVDAPPLRHSAKPEIFLELIEAYFPTMPKIELNRRGLARPGWSAWGNEAEEAGE